MEFWRNCNGAASLAAFQGLAAQDSEFAYAAAVLTSGMHPAETPAIQPLSHSLLPPWPRSSSHLQASGWDELCACGCMCRYASPGGHTRPLLAMPALPWGLLNPLPWGPHSGQRRHGGSPERPHPRTGFPWVLFKRVSVSRLHPKTLDSRPPDLGARFPWDVRGTAPASCVFKFRNHLGGKRHVGESAVSSSLLHTSDVRSAGLKAFIL